MRNCTRQKGVMKEEKWYEKKGGMKDEKLYEKKWGNEGGEMI
jgi:hypothetical protein